MIWSPLKPNFICSLRIKRGDLGPLHHRKACLLSTELCECYSCYCNRDYKLSVFTFTFARVYESDLNLNSLVYMSLVSCICKYIHTHTFVVNKPLKCAKGASVFLCIPLTGGWAPRLYSTQHPNALEENCLLPRGFFPLPTLWLLWCFSYHSFFPCLLCVL